MTSSKGEEISTKEDLLKLVYEQRDKSGKLKILEKMLDEWFTEEGHKNKILIFSQTKTILDVISMMLSQKQMKFKVSVVFNWNLLTFFSALMVIQQSTKEWISSMSFQKTLNVSPCYSLHELEA